MHHQWRRRGIGRMLLTEMERWMQTHGVAEVWVLADNPAAVTFYRACGFATEDVQPVYMLLPPAGGYGNEEAMHAAIQRIDEEARRRQAIITRSW